MPVAGGSAAARSPSNGSPLSGSAGRASVSGNILYSRPPVKSLRARRLSAGCGWYEYGVYDVAIALTEVPLRPYELEYRDRTVFSANEPEPVDLPSDRPQPVVLRVKPKPKACAPPHPSTVRVCYEPEAKPLVQPEAPDVSSVAGPKKAEAREKQLLPQPLDKADKNEPNKDVKKKEKSDKAEKSEKSEKSERPEKQSKHEKEKKRAPKDQSADPTAKEEPSTHGAAPR